MNLLQIRDKARQKANITDTTALANGTLSADINIAYQFLAEEISQITEDFFEEQKVTFNLAQNSALYSLPTDFLKLKQLRLAYSAPSDPEDYKIASGYDPMEIWNINAQEENATTTNPIVDITNSYFRIKPTPTSTVTNGGEIYYIARPSAMVATGNTPIISTEYHDLMAVYPAKEAAFRFGDYTRADRLQNEWLQSIENMKHKLASRNINRPKRFKNYLEVDKNSQTTELY